MTARRHVGQYHEYSLARAGVRILILASAGAVLGKLVAIAFVHLRARWLRDMEVRSRGLHTRIVASTPERRITVQAGDF